MKQKDILLLVVVGIVAAVFSSIIASAVFGSSKHHDLTSPNIQAINSSFPQVQNDNNYKSFFNSQALDPTQLIKIGTNQNQTPFNSSQ